MRSVSVVAVKALTLIQADGDFEASRVRVNQRFFKGTILDVECFECVVSDLAWE